MVRTSAFFTAALPLAAAYPWAMEASQEMGMKRVSEKRQASYSSSNPAYPYSEGTIPPVRQPVFVSGRSNTGAGNPNPPFNAAEQYVDVSEGSGHEFRAPGPNDLRGQCPGLNAAANHGFLNRNGIPTIANTVSGLREAYNMNEDLSLALAVISVALAGDIITQTWSIGGEYNPTGLGGLLGGSNGLLGSGGLLGGLLGGGDRKSSGGILGKPRGILGTHNKYEGDASIVRGDAYLNGGKQLFQMRSWERLYPLAASEGGLTLDKVAGHNDYTVGWSRLNNPYYFSAPFSGAVALAAHNFVVNFMSNRSAENPGGYLSADVLMSFFGVSGEPGNFVYNVGMERIPENWYKRAGGIHSYTLANVVEDGLTTNGMYPGTLSIGGNTGTVDSFTGVDLGDLTGGVFNVDTLLEGNNAACYLLQLSQAGLPDVATGLASVVGDIVGFVTDLLGPLGDSLSCPQLGNLRNELLQQFPGSAEYFA